MIVSTAIPGEALVKHSFILNWLSLGRSGNSTGDAHLLMRKRLFGHYIAEFEQNGADRAQHGARLKSQQVQRSGQAALH